MTIASPSGAILTDFEENTAIVRVNKPAERNPLSIQTLQELQNILEDLVAREEIGSIVFTGTDDVFASGANIKELTQLDSVSAIEFSRLGQYVMSTIASANQLTIAAINGYCMGGALDLALACDIRIASTDAVFAHPGAKLGIITGWGGTQRLPRLIGKTAALDLLLTARRFSATEALTLGLITNLDHAPLETARLIASHHRNKTATLKHPPG